MIVVSRKEAAQVHPPTTTVHFLDIPRRRNSYLYTEGCASLLATLLVAALNDSAPSLLLLLLWLLLLWLLSTKAVAQRHVLLYTGRL